MREDAPRHAGSSRRVPDAVMTFHTRGICGCVSQRKDLVNQEFVAPDAVTFQNVKVSALDLNRFVKVLKRKGPGVEKTIICLCDPFAEKLVGHVTIVARRPRRMATLDPRVVLRLHDVAVDARRGVIAEIRVAFTIAKCESAKAGQNSEKDRHYKGQRASAVEQVSHPLCPK